MTTRATWKKPTQCSSEVVGYSSLDTWGPLHPTPITALSFLMQSLLLNQFRTRHLPDDDVFLKHSHSPQTEMVVSKYSDGGIHLSENYLRSHHSLNRLRSLCLSGRLRAIVFSSTTKKFSDVQVKLRRNLGYKWPISTCKAVGTAFVLHPLHRGAVPFMCLY